MSVVVRRKKSSFCDGQRRRAGLLESVMIPYFGLVLLFYLFSSEDQILVSRAYNVPQCTTRRREVNVM